MAEICTAPFLLVHDGKQVYAFGPDHSIADIARWIMLNRGDAEELRDVLNDMLTGVYSLPMH